MHIELRCPRCPCHFSAPAATPADAILDHMTEEGPWYALGDGETFEDMVATALATRGRICCPECRTIVLIRTGRRARCAPSPVLCG